MNEVMDKFNLTYARQGRGGGLGMLPGGQSAMAMRSRYELELAIAHFASLYDQASDLRWAPASWASFEHRQQLQIV